MRTLALIVSLGIAFSLAMPATATAETVQLREDAPTRHVVVKGDTLWDISAKFLKSPWLWPELWRTNDDHIKNPHLIYPGDVIYLVMTPNGPRLSVMKTVKLSPGIHSEPITDAIPPIPYSAVKAFLERPSVADADTLAKAPRLIGSEDGRGMSSQGDRVYADAVGADTASWNIVRLGKPLRDPASGELLAHEVAYVGDARTVVKASPATLEITAVASEVQAGDRLIPAYTAGNTDFEPHAPAKPIDGQIISAFGRDQTTGRYETVIISKGHVDGIESGDVLAVFRAGKSVGRAEGESRTKSFSPKSGYMDSAMERGNNNTYVPFNNSGLAESGPAGATRLPDVRTGLIMVYRVFDRVSYALVLESYSPIFLLDHVGNP
ncbi:MAG: LysM domain-containing protein [Gallionellaceae bacterium]|nr:LysM domain-containing protein [Gallionellaceae bacterium]